MDTIPPPAPQLATYLSPYGDAIVDLALQLRELVYSLAPSATELIYDAYNAVAIGYSFTGRPSDGFCHIAVYSRHVNLGFNHGALLADPAGVLRGTGARVRHITVSPGADTDVPMLTAYIAAAIELDGRASESGSNQLAGKSIVRAEYARTRRPKPAHGA